MKLIEKKEKDRWSEKSCIEFTLREIQIIFDALGSSCWKDYEKNWEMYDNPLDIPYNIDDTDNLYSEFEDLVGSLGGVVLG